LQVYVLLEAKFTGSCCFLSLLAACAQDYERRTSDADDRYYSSESRFAWKDAEDAGYREPVESQLARSGRRMHWMEVRHHAHYDGSRHSHHDDTVTDLDDMNWNAAHDTHGSQYYAADYERPTPSVDYEQQLRRHGWRMEVHGDPLHLKYV